MRDFDPGRLRVYGIALSFVDVVERLVRRFPAEQRDLARQLRRAAASIVLNVAEGAGEFSPAEKRRFYRMARRSGTECVAALDIVRRLHLAPEADLPKAETLLRQIIAILTRLSKPPTLQGNQST